MSNQTGDKDFIKRVILLQASVEKKLKKIPLRSRNKEVYDSVKIKLEEKKKFYTKKENKQKHEALLSKIDDIFISKEYKSFFKEFESITKCLVDKPSIKNFREANFQEKNSVHINKRWDFFPIFLGYDDWDSADDANFEIKADVNDLKYQEEKIEEHFKESTAQKKDLDSQYELKMLRKLLEKNFVEINGKLDSIRNIPIAEIDTIRLNDLVREKLVKITRKNVDEANRRKLDYIFNNDLFLTIVYENEISNQNQNFINSVLLDLEIEDFKFNWTHRTILAGALTLSVISSFNLEKLRLLVVLAQRTFEPSVSSQAMLGLCLALIASFKDKKQFHDFLKIIKPLEGVIRFRGAFWFLLKNFFYKWNDFNTKEKDQLIYSQFIRDYQFQWFIPANYHFSYFETTKEEEIIFKDFFIMLDKSVAFSCAEKSQISFLLLDLSKKERKEFISEVATIALKQVESSFDNLSEYLEIEYENAFERFAYTIKNCEELQRFDDVIKSFISSVSLEEISEEIFEIFPFVGYCQTLEYDSIKEKLNFGDAFVRMKLSYQLNDYDYPAWNVYWLSINNLKKVYKDYKDWRYYNQYGAYMSMIAFSYSNVFSSRYSKKKALKAYYKTLEIYKTSLKLKVNSSSFIGISDCLVKIADLLSEKKQYKLYKKGLLYLENYLNIYIGDDDIFDNQIYIHLKLANLSRNKDKISHLLNAVKIYENKERESKFSAMDHEIGLCYIELANYKSLTNFNDMIMRGLLALKRARMHSSVKNEIEEKIAKLYSNLGNTYEATIWQSKAVVTEPYIIRGLIKLEEGKQNEAIDLFKLGLESWSFSKEFFIDFEEELERHSLPKNLTNSVKQNLEKYCEEKKSV